jgi:hypothetical protein
MLITRTPILLALLVGATLIAACKSKGPAPGDALTESEEVIMAERANAPSAVQKLGIPTQDYERDYRTTPHDPHGPAGHLNPPPSHVSGDVELVDVGGLTFKAPEGWEYQHPTSAMRRAEFGARGDDGTAGLVVYFFGNQGAGSPQANIDRWVGQFKNADGTPITASKPVTSKIAGLEVTQVEVAGTYMGGMGAGAADAQGQPGQRMIAAIVDTPKGPFYFKFLGADEVVIQNREALEGLFASMTTPQP